MFDRRLLQLPETRHRASVVVLKIERGVSLGTWGGFDCDSILPAALAIHYGPVPKMQPYHGLLFSSYTPTTHIGSHL